ncbi:MAG: acetylornithine/N-succinyldiaminopimelate aminotransferase [Cellvibrionaceae bacterium]|jgi:acetylornithine/N-succinyldiaminopimelate aminotransferase
MNDKVLMNTYGQHRLSLIKGEGCYVWDNHGKQYLDALSGIAVCGLGHCHPAVTEAIQQQAQTLIHTSNLYHLPVQQQAGEDLCRVSGMEKVFFCNSGAEANEAALKIARKYGHDRGIATPTVITMSGSFHGRTMATLTATANAKVKQGFAPLLEGFVHVPFDDIEAVAAYSDNPNVVALLVEPIQGEGGIQIPGDHYLPQLRQLCDDNDWLLMLDEVQSGNARTGHHFAYQAGNYKPDVMTTAKGLGNGVPVGACMTRGKASEVLQPGNHGSTYGGNPLACATVSAVINTIDREQLCQQASSLGEYFRRGFHDALAHKQQLQQIRVKGLMIGIELREPCTELVGQAADKALLINVTADSVIRLLPPLIISRAQADRVIETVASLIH